MIKQDRLRKHVELVCRVCGDPITTQDVDWSRIVIVGYDKHGITQLAHAKCLKLNRDRTTWRYP
jgi:hypothetical protein